MFYKLKYLYLYDVSLITDVAKDTSDTELSSRDSDDDFTTEFDVATDEEQPFVDSNNSGSSEEVCAFFFDIFISIY